MDQYNLYVLVRPVAESIAETRFGVSISERRPTGEIDYSDYMSMEEAATNSEFSHFFTWNYQDVDHRLQALNTGETDARQLRTFGKFLHKQLFDEDKRAGRVLKEHITRARGQEGKVLLRLMFGSSSLNAIPWEYTYYPGERTYLALVPEVCLTRFQPSHITWKRQSVTPPLKVLLVDCLGPEQASEGDLMSLKDDLLTPARARDNLEVEVIHYTSQDDLRERLISGKFHAVHFFAHVESSTDEAYLVLYERGMRWMVCGTSLLARLFIGSSVRLLALTPCGSKGQPWTVNFIGCRVHEIGVPAVLTTQIEFKNKWVTDFTRAFYPSLAKGCSLDSALADARRGLAQRIREPVGTFALFLSTHDSQLFDFVDRPTTKETRPTEADTRQFLINTTQQVASVVGGQVVGTTMDDLLDSDAVDTYLKEKGY